MNSLFLEVWDRWLINETKCEWCSGNGEDVKAKEMVIVSNIGEHNTNSYILCAFHSENVLTMCEEDFK